MTNMFVGITKMQSETFCSYQKDKKKDICA